MKNRHIYTEEEKKFLEENSSKYTRKELAKTFNKTFNTDLSSETLRFYCVRHGLIHPNAEKYNKGFYYTEEQKKFLEENSPILSRKELTELFNEKFNLNCTKEVLERYCSKKKWLRKTEPIHKFTKQQLSFLEENYSKYDRKTLTELFNEQFGLNLNVSNIISACLKRSWKAPSDGIYRKGRISWCKGIRGEEYKKHFSKEALEKMKQRGLTCKRKYNVGDVFYSSSKEAYVIVVSDERNVKFEKRIMYYSRYLYEKFHNVKLKDNEKIIFLDGDSSNFNIENLKCVDSRILCGINAMGLYGKGKLTEAITEVYKTQFEVNDFFEKGVKNG